MAASDDDDLHRGAPEPQPPDDRDYGAGSDDGIGPGFFDAEDGGSSAMHDEEWPRAAMPPSQGPGPQRLYPPRAAAAKPAYAAAGRRQPLEPAQHSHLVPPADLFCERAIVAACLSDADALALAQTTMRAEDLYDVRHRETFSAMIAIASRGDPVDAVTVMGELARAGHTELVPADYLAELAFAPGSASSVEAYGRRVAKLAVVRKVLDATHQLQATGYQAGVDPDAFLELTDRLFRTAMDSAVRGGPQQVGELVGEVFQDIMDARERGGDVTGISSGFRDIDAKHLGLHATDLIVLAARPAMGKSAFALNLAYQVARQHRRKQDGTCRVVIFSLEMGKKQLVQRFFSARSNVDLTSLRKGDLSPQDEASLRDAAAEIADLEIYLDDSGALTPADIRARSKRVAMSGSVDLIVVDYLQLMRGTGGPKQSKEQEIAECSMSMKALAKELNCTVLALSQLNREVENRTGKKPQMSDLRGSGSIEQDADIIWFIHREGYYDQTKDQHLAELIVAKHRAGETGSVQLHFEGRLTKFGTYDDRINDQYAYG